jgi:hypothetical protein
MKTLFAGGPPLFRDKTFVNAVARDAKGIGHATSGVETTQSCCAAHRAIVNAVVR